MLSDINLGPIVNNASYFETALTNYKNNLSFGHQNCQSIRPSDYNSKLDELKCVLMGSGIDIFCISETWLKSSVSSSSLSIPGYSFLRNDRPARRGGGVGIYINEGIKHKVVFRSSRYGVCESLFIEICSGTTKVLFGTVYLPHGDIDEFEEVHADLLVGYSEVIIVGDFNCNLFNFATSSSVRSVCHRLNLAISHNSLPTHFDMSHSSTSLIDYVLISNPAKLKFSSQVQFPSMSHHSLIFGSLDLSVSHEEKYVEYRDYRKICWNSFFEYLSHFNFDHFYTSSDVDIKLSVLDHLISELFSFVPLVKRKFRNVSDQWLRSRDITLSRSLRDIAYREYRRQPTDDNLRIYRMYRNRAKAVLRRERRRHGMMMFKGLDNAQVWRTLRTCCFEDNVEMMEVDVNAVNDYFLCSTPDHPELLSDTSDSAPLDYVFSFDCIFEDDILNALNRINTTSVGVDGIPIKFVKMIFPFISTHLLHLINFIFTSSTFPNAWKMARVVPIPKIRCSCRVEDFRPISILPAISKIVEHIIHDSILCFLNDRNMITDYQYGFRRGFSTTSHLLHLTDTIRGTLDVGGCGVLVGLDLSKAFDRIDHFKLISKLRNIFQFSSTACRLISSYLCGRTQFVSMNGMESDLRPVNCGVPQGSILGPLLFILYVNDIANSLAVNGCSPFLYADDIHIFFRSDSHYSLETVINSTLETINVWLIENNLCVNASKTKALLFGSVYQDEISININGTSVEFVDEMKCLGVVIDAHLDFVSHINSVLSKVFFMIRRLYSTNIYLPRYIKRRVAYSTLLSQINYGIEVISGTLSGNFKKIERIVNLIVRYVYGLRRSDHISEKVIEFLGCSLRKYVDLRILQSFYKLIISNSPPMLRRQFVFGMSIRSPQLLIPRFTTSIYERSFLIRVARVWNRLPLHLRTFSFSNHVFRQKILEHFLNVS